MSRLDPVAQKMIDDSRASGQPNAHLLPVADARTRFEAAFADLQKPDVFETREVSIPTRDGQTIRGRLYMPSEKPSDGIVLYFHGGGWLLGSIDSHDVTTRKLALASGLPVLSVDYRRGPEAKFPTAVNDALDAYTWATSDENPLGLSDNKRVAVAGDSAGGNLSAAVANELRGQQPAIRHQMLAYPVVTWDLDLGTDPEFEGIMLERDELLWHQENYLASPEDKHDPRVSMLEADLAGTAEATVILAECDPIRPNGELYIEALKAAGVPVEWRQWDGMLHGFFGLDEVFPIAAEAMEFAGARLAEAMK